VEFLCRGYQVSLRGDPYYEERAASGERRRLAFEWFPLNQGYRARCVVRLPRRDRWEVDAPAWAGGRRDEIAARITKDLSSYEGWPALLMPDAPAVDSTSDATVTSALMQAILAGCPEWAPYVIPGSEIGHLDSVLLSVPPPEHPSHRLEVVY